MPRPANPRPYHKVVTRYVDSDGRRCAKSAPGAQKITTRTTIWYADVPGMGTISLGTADEHQAWITLRDKMKQAREMQLGIFDEHTDHARTEIEAHIEQWGEVLAAKGTSGQQIALAVGRLKRLARLAGWKRLHQISHDSAMLALARVQAPKTEGGLGKSAASRNHYLGHLKAFASWAHEGGRVKQNTVRRIAPVNVETDRRHVRRVPSLEEMAELCRWLESPAAPVRRLASLSGRERRLGYLVSAATGFRAGELRAMTPESFDLLEGAVTVPAGYSKRRRTDTQRLPAWLVEELRDWFEQRGTWRWCRLNRNGPGEMLQADLEGCRAAWIAAGTTDGERQERQASDFLKYRIETPAGPRFWDYHSFRHAYNSMMANRPNMDLKTLLTLTRLSSAELALKTYAHTEEERIRAAVADIPPPQGRQP